MPGACNSAVAEAPVENYSKKPELKAMIFSRHLTKALEEEPMAASHWNAGAVVVADCQNA